MSADEKHGGSFKECAMCGRSWADLSEFVLDIELRVDGYQACFLKPEMGLVLVTHEVEGCGTTLAVRATLLRSLYDGPEYTQRRTGQAVCSGACLRMNRVEECEADCDMAWVRTVMQYLRRHELPPHIQ